MSKIARVFKPLKFAKYLRKSREEKELSTEEVLKSHNNILNEVCTRMNIKVDEEDTYKELVTGESIAIRPQMQKLLAKIEEGYYDALILRLGSGEGNNWWCLVYPAFCFTNSSNPENVEYTSKIWEIIQKIF